MKTPKLAIFLTIPLCFVPTAYFNSKSLFFHGSSVNCFTPSDIFLSSLSSVRTIASISSPTLAKS
jgi:hypothetical protein